MKIIEKDNKIPEKIEFYIVTEKTRDFRIISPYEIAIKINEIIDYLKSKGE